MAGEIINRVAGSALQVIDLEEFYLDGTRTLLSITDFLDDGVLLREQSFRERLSSHDWTAYKDHFVAVHCPEDVLVPQWATLLLIRYLQPVTKAVVVGTIDDLERFLFTEKLAVFDITPYKNGLVMIKGCANKPVPQQAMGILTAKLIPVVRKLSYGEACSSVPLYSKPK
ncbi:MAG: DUF2480 family protein [Bacteroidetes bacterium]|nr:DUF2480 family protein [Bacteroidota bacterium]MDA0888486.1 DUF2480 family protein [Bacteroidota bacterium]MDA1084129.1 DUF2480 family protein [Bacteroidota bacterium]